MKERKGKKRVNDYKKWRDGFIERIMGSSGRAIRLQMKTRDMKEISKFIQANKQEMKNEK